MESSHLDKQQEIYTKSNSKEEKGTDKKNTSISGIQFNDNRPEANTGKNLQLKANNFSNPHHQQLKALQEKADNSPQVKQAQTWQEKANNSPRVKQLMAFQEKANNSPQVQRAKQLQAKADQFVAKNSILQKKENKTGLPDQLKSGVENLSGLPMDDVQVHYNSSKPSQLQAHAYAEGTDIHLASGQEKHLPHEAWHVVQQKQGRVQPTLQKKGVNINDDSGLEQEADVMGQMALQAGLGNSGDDNPPADNGTKGINAIDAINGTIQRKVIQLQKYGAAEADKAEEKKNLALAEIASEKYAEAFAIYKEVKLIVADLYEHNYRRTKEVFNPDLHKVDRCMSDIKQGIQDGLSTRFDGLVRFYKDLYENYERDYNLLYTQMVTVLGEEGDVTNLNKDLFELGNNHLQAYGTKTNGIKEIDKLNKFAKEDIALKYPGQDREIQNTKIEELDIPTLKSIVLKNVEIHTRQKNHRKVLAKTIATPEDKPQREGTMVLLMADTEERKNAVSQLVDGNVGIQLSIFTQINKHHRSDDIADVVELLRTIGLDNLNDTLRLIGVVASKGSIREIKLFFESTRAVTGNPDISGLCNFLTGLEYNSLTSLSSFVKEAGKLANLDGIKPVWEAVNLKNNLAIVLQLFAEGIIPSTFTQNAMVIALAFANKTGASNAEDWSKLLRVKDWELQQLIALALTFDSNPKNLTAEQWAETGEKHPELKTKPEEVGATSYLNKYANDEWYDKIKPEKLSSTDRSKKKYTQLLYTLLGNTNLSGLGTVNFDNIKGDFLSMLVFFHRHIATFVGDQGQGFDRQGKGSGKYARSNYDHPLNEQYQELLSDERVNVSELLQPINTTLFNLESKGRVSKDTRDFNQPILNGTTYNTGKISLASAGLPSHNLKMLQDQQDIVSQSNDTSKAKKKLFDAPTLTKAPNQSRTLDSKSTILDGVVESQKVALSGKILNDNSYNSNFHDSMLQDRGQLVNRLSTAINSISGGSRIMHAIGSQGHPSLVLHVPTPGIKEFYYNNTRYTSTKKIVPQMVNDFNSASGQNVKLTVRGSFGFQRPTLADTGESVRLWPGYAPVESLLPGLKVLVEKLNSKTTPDTTEMTNMHRLTSLTSPGNQPVLYVEALKTAMRHAFIALNNKISNTATAEKKRVYDWLRTRMLIKLKQSGILLSKATALYSNTSTASQADKDKHFLVTADMTDKLQEYTMLYTATTLDNTANPNQNHTETEKFKNDSDVYEQKLTSILRPTDYRIYYLDSGEQALITAGILANRYQKRKSENDSNVEHSFYYNINPYFEIGEFSGDTRSNLKQGNDTSKIVHTDLSPVITKDRTTPKSKTDILNDTKSTWQDTRTGNVKRERKDVIPIIDITNSSLSEVSNLGKMPENFIIVESLTKHQQLGADKFIMGRLIAVSNTEGTKGNNVLSNLNFLDLSQKIVGPVANEAYNPLLAQIRSNMDKALYTDEIV